MDQLYFSRLPKELIEEILMYSSLKDIKNFFLANEIQFSCQDLYYLAVRFDLPSATSIDALISHSIKDLHDHISYTIKYYDLESLNRLLPKYNKPVDFYILLDLIDNFQGPIELLYMILNHASKFDEEFYDPVWQDVAIITKDKDMIDLFATAIHEDDMKVIVQYTDIDTLEYCSKYAINSYWKMAFSYSISYLKYDMLKYIIEKNVITNYEDTELFPYPYPIFTKELVDILYPIAPVTLENCIIDSNQDEVLKLLATKTIRR